MKTHEYSLRELDFIAGLAFYDFKQAEIVKRQGVGVNRIWQRIGEKLKEEFDLTDREENYALRFISRSYENDPELVDPRTRYDIM